MSHHHNIGSSHLLAGAAAVGATLPPTPQFKSGPSLSDEIKALAGMRRDTGVAAPPKLRPLDLDERSGNELRPSRFADLVGQERLKPLLERLVENARATGKPLDHLLLVGGSGTGKTTLGLAIANELGRRVFMLHAPIDIGTFEELAKVGEDGDVVFCDEIHLQCGGDRRGITQSADVETFFAALEDRRLALPTGTIPFPAVTFIGATTTLGLLPEPFINRFPLRPVLDSYSEGEMALLAEANATALRSSITHEAAVSLARAARGNPRAVNSYIRNALSLGSGIIDQAVAVEVIVTLNGNTLDGLTPPMQGMLRYLLRSPKTTRQRTVYQASVNSIATALEFSRDSKHVALYVEPELLKRSYVQVCSGGRTLTPSGIARARAL